MRQKICDWCGGPFETSPISADGTPFLVRIGGDEVCGFCWATNGKPAGEIKLLTEEEENGSE